MLEKRPIFKTVFCGYKNIFTCQNETCIYNFDWQCQLYEEDTNQKEKNSMYSSQPTILKQKLRLKYTIQLDNEGNVTRIICHSYRTKV